jgi:hypothetical protein
MLLEFDERFAVFKDDFSFYDYKQPIKLDGKAPQQWLDNRNANNNKIASLKGSFDRIICDPPFLNEDCQSKGNHITHLFSKLLRKTY